MPLETAYKELDSFIALYGGKKFDDVIHLFRHQLNYLAIQCSVSPANLFIMWMNTRSERS